MKLKWLGHSAFVITSDTGIKLITDPYATDDRLSYGEIKESADIVTVSHDHSDHNNVSAVQGNPEVVKGEGLKWVLPSTIFKASGARSSILETDKDKEEIGYMRFRGIPTYHDAAKGQQRGNNTIFCFEVDGVKVCHLGDLGHPLNERQAAELGEVDILLIPVGGFYTIDAIAASQVCERLKPRVIIPMHYRNNKCAFPISGVDEFLQGKKNVSRLDASEVEFKSGKLPADTQIIVLQPSL